LSLPLSTIWRIARRDLNARIRGLRLLAICLFLGVATLAAIGSLSAGIGDELSRRGQTILGGDIEIEIAQREATAEELSAFGKIGTLSQTIRLRAMAIEPKRGESTLSELKAVDGAYPLFGAFTLQNGKKARAPAKGNVYVAPNMSDKLGVSVGDTIRFGEAELRVTGIIANEPDRLGEGFALGPVVIASLESLSDTKLLQPGSLFNAKYRIKIAPNADPIAIVKTLKAEFPSAGWEVTDRSNGAPGTRRFIDRMGQFLTLVGLAALVIAGIGVGNGVASYLAGKRGSIATLKVIGADSRTIFQIYLAQILVVAALAIIIGLLTGTFAPLVFTQIAGDILPIAPGLKLFPLPLITSALYGILIALAFALPPLSRAKTVPAAGLSRSVVENDNRIETTTVFAVIVTISAVIALAVLSSNQPLFSLGFIAAAIVLLAILTALASALRRLAMMLPRPSAPLLRSALANLHRPGSQLQPLVVALGLGLTLFVTLAAVQTSINNEIARSVPERAPSFFVLDIPKQQSQEFGNLIRTSAPNAVINMIPALRGSIIAFGGQRVDAMTEIPENAWVLRGDRGLTYATDLPKGSSITAGHWWPTDYVGPPLVSIEQDVAESLSLSVGDTLTVSVLGVEVEAKIASLRTVEWDNFGLNYVLVFSPGSIDRAPHNMVATVTVAKSVEGKLARAIPQKFPSASLIEVGEVVGQVNILLKQMAQAIAAAASIAILAGIAVLVGAIAASRATRIYDSVIFKLLGATRRQILGAQAIEYGVLAIALGLLSLALGMGAAWYVVVQIFDFAFAPDPAILALTLIGGAGLTFLLGILGSMPILAAKPAEALRSL
jgi:putative ABC transport system permease protein